jgi:nitroreductase
MDTYDVVNERRSIRSYKKDPVSRETLLKIIDAALAAPSWSNKQCWRFVVVDAQVEKKLIGEASGQENIIKACGEAPCVVVLCANPRESGSKNGLEYYMFDCGLAMENLALAAREEGLGTCIVGWFDERTVKGILNIPDDFRVVSYTPLGYPNEAVPKRPRKKREETVFLNSWGRRAGG